MSVPLSFVSWNCRGGILFSRKQNFIRHLISSLNLAFIGLVETKKEHLDDFSVCKLWPNHDFQYEWIASTGASGGLLLIWSSVMLRNVSTSKGARWISMDFLFEDTSCRHILIYASNLASERVIFWQELSSLLEFASSIIISGDFNDILHPEDRLNSVGYSPSMLALGEFVNSSQLLDLPLQGRNFTWQNSFSRSRIDRCLISSAAGTIWPFMSLSALPGNLSDHVPICFRSPNTYDWGPKPFRSVDSWWDHEDFSKVVADGWSLACEKSPNLTIRLKELRLFVKKWNHDVFGDQRRKVKELTEDIFSKEASADYSPMSKEQRVLLGNLKKDLWTAERRLESIWIQKSRLKWSTEGDRNTKFFHSVASKHYRNNHISSIQVDENVVSEPSDIRSFIIDFFKSLYSQQEKHHYTLQGLIFDKILQEDGDSLILPFSEEEIFKAIYACGENKAPGPDGFNFYFFRRAWPCMKKEIREFFDDFYRYNSLPKGINTSFMVLVPKVAGSVNIKDYRPISLVNGFFKLLSKTLSLRLAPLLTKVISDS
ncbi:uncharacterized protein LOC126681423 [Mercurialis annua]|uniref:uncharacterized protein LOC126681423 n=1 Tax=Mercurialis annua TaxID=3986 RepID=UPI00215F96B1|nr:uncharacterized protein LOC126681423 [Mercurialis annua]